jgi:hypothetical protein
MKGRAMFGNYLIDGKHGTYKESEVSPTGCINILADYS